MTREEFIENLNYNCKIIDDNNLWSNIMPYINSLLDEKESLEVQLKAKDEHIVELEVYLSNAIRLLKGAK